MTITKLLASAVTVTALTFTGSPAFAQHRGGGGGARTQSSGRTQSSARAQSSSRAPSSGGAVARRSAPVIVGRTAPRSGGPVYVAPRVVGSRGYSVGPSFYRPYYTFRPRLSLGFGLYAGYPVAFPYYGAYGYPYGYYDPYYDPYAYAAPYGYPAYSAPAPYGYGAPAPYGTSGAYAAPAPAPNSIGVQPGVATGGLSFDMSPANAEVFVDGQDYGPVSSFSPTSQPLSLTPGRHRVELRAPGYETMMFDADVVAGQVIPYQGTLQTMRR
jgi:hypothetical protein